MKYYSLDRIKKENATYSIIIGERSNGKTYACLREILRNYVETSECGAYIRRWDEDIKGITGQKVFGGLVQSGEIRKATKGVWEDVYYYNRQWYLCRYEDEKRIVDLNPFCYAFALTQMEHYKSSNYDNVTTILFDEFLTRKEYLPDETIIFFNQISTIIRNRTNVKIYMCANTINKYAPYFKEMGLNNIATMEQGSIQVYTYGDSKLKVAVEYCASGEKIKENNHYFAFNNPKLQVITNGAWEVDVYPHKPTDFKRSNIVTLFFIMWEDAILQCELVSVDSSLFIYIHLKTTPIKDNNHLIFSPEYHHERNYVRDITKPINNLHKRILYLFSIGKVFYQNNEIGEIVRNYFLKFGRALNVN